MEAQRITYRQEAENMEHEILISLGSNHNAAANMQHAYTALREKFPQATFSHILSTEPIGMDGPYFLNSLCHFYSSLSLSDITSLTKQMEIELGDNKGERAKGHVAIDIDILQYDSQRLHLNDWQRPYIKPLLDDIF